METFQITHKYNGKRVGQLSQNTTLVINGALSLNECIQLFVHFVGTVWQEQVSVQRANETSEQPEPVNAIGFDCSKNEMEDADA
jgi:hypothetical protein